MVKAAVCPCLNVKIYSLVPNEFVAIIKPLAVDFLRSVNTSALCKHCSVCFSIDFTL